MNTLPVISRHNFRSFSINGLITDTVLYLGESNDVCRTSTKLVQELVDVPVVFDDDVYARMFVKALMVQLFNHKYDIDDLMVPEILEGCHHKAFSITGAAEWSFLYSGEKVDVVRPISKSEPIKVMDEKTGAVRIKKGGKVILAEELFLVHVVNAVVPMAFPEFKKLIMKELNMTDMGSNTYVYNLKTKYGMIKKK